jgi:hypothetical protein
VKEDVAKRNAEKEVENGAENEEEAERGVEAKKGNREVMTARGNETVNVKRD